MHRVMKWLLLLCPAAVHEIKLLYNCHALPGKSAHFVFCPAFGAHSVDKCCAENIEAAVIGSRVITVKKFLVHYIYVICLVLIDPNMMMFKIRFLSNTHYAIV